MRAAFGTVNSHLTAAAADSNRDRLHTRIARFQFNNQSYVGTFRRPGDTTGEFLQNEGIMMRHAGSSLAPDVVFSNNEFLICSEVRDAPTLHDAILSTRKPDFGEFGVLLASIHANEVPRILSRHETPCVDPLTPKEWALTPDAVLRTIADVGHRDILHRIIATGVNDTGSTFIHGDFKPDNLLWLPSGSAVAVDWELAGRGHAVTDFAALFAGTIVAEVAAATKKRSTAEDFTPYIELAVANVLEDFDAFCTGYRRIRRIDWTATRFIELAAVRLTARAQGLATHTSGRSALLTAISGLSHGLLENLPAATKTISSRFGVPL